MINDTEIDINAGVAIASTKLQTEVSEATKNYLRHEALRQKLTMGQLLDKIVQLVLNGSVPEITS